MGSRRPPGSYRLSPLQESRLRDAARAIGMSVHAFVVQAILDAIDRVERKLRSSQSNTNNRQGTP